MNEIWRKAFDILLSSGSTYMYDYDAAIKELDEKGFSIALASNPKEPETVHGNEAEKEVTFCEMCVRPDWCADKGFCIRMNPEKM